MKDTGDLIQRDRSHPSGPSVHCYWHVRNIMFLSVFAWNLCNEVMCKDDATTAKMMRNVTTTYDGTRPITMNHIVTMQGALPYLDVQGMSHRSGGTMDSFHQANPTKPLFSSEAATCSFSHPGQLAFPRGGKTGKSWSNSPPVSPQKTFAPE